MIHAFKTAAKTEKVSDNIISQIRDAVLSGKLKPGDRVASEKELIAHFGVSKATVREALRALEVMGLVEIRKGIGGGVFIAEVDMKTTIHGIMNFLHFKSVSVRDITMIRYFLEPPIARIAAARIREQDLENLREMIPENHSDPGTVVAKEIGFHRYLARMTENPILILIMDFIDNMLRDIKFQVRLAPSFYEGVAEAHRQVLECLGRGDGTAAGAAILRDLLWVGDYLSAATDSPAFDPSSIPSLRELEGIRPLAETESGESDALPCFSAEEIECLKKGAVLKRIGTGDLYLISLKSKDPSLKLKA